MSSIGEPSSEGGGDVLRVDSDLEREIDEDIARMEAEKAKDPVGSANPKEKSQTPTPIPGPSGSGEPSGAQAAVSAGRIRGATRRTQVQDSQEGQP